MQIRAASHGGGGESVGGGGGRTRRRKGGSKKSRRIRGVSGSLLRSTASTRAKGPSYGGATTRTTTSDTGAASAAGVRGVRAKRSVAASRRRRAGGGGGGGDGHQNVHDELVEANLGRPVPFLLGKSAKPSFSVYGQVQCGIHDDAAYGNAMNSQKHYPGGEGGGGGGGVAPPAALPPPSVSAPLSSSTTQHLPFSMLSVVPPASVAPSSPPPPPSHPHNHSADADVLKTSDVEMDAVVGSLERELADLTVRYKTLLTIVSREGGDGDGVAQGELAR